MNTDKKLAMISVIFALSVFTFIQYMEHIPPGDISLEIKEMVYSYHAKGYTFILTKGQGIIRLDGNHILEHGASYLIEGELMPTTDKVVKIKPYTITKLN